jgi:hypothetical protein
MHEYAIGDRVKITDGIGGLAGNVGSLASIVGVPGPHSLNYSLSMDDDPSFHYSARAASFELAESAMMPVAEHVAKLREIVSVAWSAAISNEWCEEFERHMATLDLTQYLPPSEKVIEVTTTVRVTIPNARTITEADARRNARYAVERWIGAGPGNESEYESGHEYIVDVLSTDTELIE